jgi:hypothetical protein
MNYLFDFAFISLVRLIKSNENTTSDKSRCKERGISFEISTNERIRMFFVCFMNLVHSIGVELRH